MAEVKISGLYKVTVTEYERGWGQRVDPEDTKFFTTLEEAKAYQSTGKRAEVQTVTGVLLSKL